MTAPGWQPTQQSPQQQTAALKAAQKRFKTSSENRL
jgi:hypothetical protein